MCHKTLSCKTENIVRILLNNLIYLLRPHISKNVKNVKHSLNASMSQDGGWATVVTGTGSILKKIHSNFVLYKP